MAQFVCDIWASSFDTKPACVGRKDWQNCYNLSVLLSTRQKRRLAVISSSLPRSLTFLGSWHFVRPSINPVISNGLWRIFCLNRIRRNNFWHLKYWLWDHIESYGKSATLMGHYNFPWHFNYWVLFGKEWINFVTLLLTFNCWLFKVVECTYKAKKSVFAYSFFVFEPHVVC